MLTKLNDKDKRRKGPKEQDSNKQNRTKKEGKGKQ